MIRSAAITESTRPTQDDLLSFVEGTLSPEREAQVRASLEAVPGALERAEAMRRDRAALGKAGSSRTVRAPMSATTTAIEQAWRKNKGWRRWTPALIGAGGLFAAALAWVVFVKSAWMTGPVEEDMERFTLGTESDPTPAQDDHTEIQVNSFLTNPIASKPPTEQPAEEITAALPDHHWAAVDSWGFRREVDAYEATEWLRDRRLAVTIHVRDARDEHDQLRLFSVLDTVRLVGPGALQDDGESAPAPRFLNAVDTTRTTEGQLFGVIDPGPLEEGAQAPSDMQYVRALDAWLTNLPLLEGASLELLELDEADRLPDVPEELKGTMFERRQLLVIRIAPEPLGASHRHDSGGTDSPAWLDSPRPGALRPASPGAR